MIIPLLFIHSLSSLPINNSCTPENRLYDCTMELICNNEGYCDICHSDDECDNFYYCRYNKKEHNKLCRFEPLMHKWNTRTIIGMILVFISGIFVSGVGIGGAALFVPIMILVNSYSAEYSVSSSNPIIIGGSLAVCIFNIRLKHPDYDRPLINYNVAAIIEPISWLGTIIGVIMNGASPSWLLYIMQFAIYSYTCVSTFKKGYKDYIKMKQKKEKEKELDDINKNTDDNDVKETDNLTKVHDKLDFQDEGEASPLENQEQQNDKKNNDDDQEKSSINDNKDDKINDKSDINSNNDKINNNNGNDKNDIINKGSKSLLKKTKSSKNDLEEPLNPNENESQSKKAFSPWVLIILAIIWAVFCILPFIRGGKTTESIVNIKFCSSLYWIVTFVPFPFYFLISYIMIRIAKNYPVLGTNADLNWKQITQLIVFGFTAGFFSGFLGIGGGVIKGPMLLALGIEAEEMAATSTFMVLLTSSITTIQFLAKGTLLYSEFGIYIAFGFVSFLIGINILKIIINKTNNRSIVLWILSAAIGISVMMIIYIGINDFVDSIKKHKKMGFRPYC